MNNNVYKNIVCNLVCTSKKMFLHREIDSPMDLWINQSVFLLENSDCEISFKNQVKCFVGLIDFFDNPSKLKQNSVIKNAIHTLLKV